MTATEIIEELKSLGSPSIKKVLLKHGAKEPFFGVKVEELKKIQKRIKKDHQLALELYDTGISDAMYLAGLIVDDAQMTKKDLNDWVKAAHWSLLSESTVPWVAAESRFGAELAREWIESKKENIAASGWCTLSSLVAIKPDSELDLDELRSLLKRVATTIQKQPNRVRYVMNGFVVAVGSHVKALTEEAIATAKAMGEVHVDMGETSCLVPDAVEALRKLEAKGNLGKKRKTAKC